MAINPIEVNGMLVRTQDLSAIKQNEDNRAILQQGNVANSVVKKMQEKHEQVVNAEKTEYNEYRYDAKEKGNGSYQGNRRKKENKEKEEDGKVVKKQPGGFDMRI